jgi:hypothetical protein
MGGGRIAVYALLLFVALALLDWRLRTPADALSHDADLVYCLAPAHTESLVNAGISLGLGTAGPVPGVLDVGQRDLTPNQWRTVDDSDFERACAALATSSLPASMPGSGDEGSGIQQVLDVLLPVVAGALLTLAADDVKQASDRRWAQADELRTNWAAFEGSVLSYVKLRLNPPSTGLPSLAELDGNRRALQGTLRKIFSQHRKSPTIRGLRSLLSGSLGSTLSEGWGRSGDPDVNKKRRDRENEVRDCLDNFGADLEKVAATLERGIWLSRKL